MNVKQRVIHGGYDLYLVPGNRYYINYGIHQGIYVYEGQVNEPGDFWEGASVFVNVKTREEFRYFGTNSPYEFTSIVKPWK